MGFNNDFSEEIWRTTYRYNQEFSIEDTHRRTAKAIASVEKTEVQQSYWEDKFFSILDGFYFCPAGRILANAGTHYTGTTLFNCYVGTRPAYDMDSLDGILETLRIQAQTLKSEGGWGMNFSFIRPRGSSINGIGVESPGAVKYMELFNKSSDIITSGSGKEDQNKDPSKKGKIRKGAQMGMLCVWHPDIVEFITAKRVPNKLDKFNVSVVCDKLFMDKVTRVESSNIDEDWQLLFPETTHIKYKEEWDGNLYRWLDKGYPVRNCGSISIKKLWDLIMRSTYNYNDPGIFFEDIVNKTHLFNYNLDKYILASNPCGEQSMPFGSVCDLGSIVLPYFFTNGKFDFATLKEKVKIAVRFLDNVNDYSSTPHEVYTKSARESRRIGLGLMGWGSLLYLMGIRYGSDQAEDLKQNIMKVFTYSAVETSIELAIEKGTFIGCDKYKLANHPFWDQIDLPKKLRKLIQINGLRNSAFFSLQPTGNTGCLMNVVTGGCEPMYLWDFVRTMIVQNAPENIKDKCPKYLEGEFKETEFFKLTKEGQEDILRGIDENSTVWKIDRNRGLTKEVLCEDYSVKTLRELNQWDEKADWAVTTDTLSVDEHIRDLAGWAKWIDAAISKTINVPNDYPYESFKNIYLDVYKSGVIKGVTSYRAGTMTNVLAAKKPLGIVKTTAPKRPKNLPCKVFYPSLKGQKYYVVVGLLGDDLYEIFAGKLTEDIPHKEVDGEIEKVRKGNYRFVKDELVLIENLVEHCDPAEESICRLLSAGLRHGAEIKFLVEQLNQSKGDLSSFSKVLARTIKRFIPDNASGGEDCPECGEDLIYREGCKSCLCGWSKC